MFYKRKEREGKVGLLHFLVWILKGREGWDLGRILLSSKIINVPILNLGGQDFFTVSRV